jgi:hypothetical protein
VAWRHCRVAHTVAHLSVAIVMAFQRVLTDDTITKQFEKTVKGVLCREHAAAQHRAALKRLLAIILFLDRAKASNTFDAKPACLFVATAQFKSSKALLCRLSAELLSGEGDIVRHMAAMGYVLSCEQHPLDEFSFRVANLADDLRDGVRLVRLYEVVSKLTPLVLCKVRPANTIHDCSRYTRCACVCVFPRSNPCASRRRPSSRRFTT